jgi:hypothetical protein
VTAHIRHIAIDYALAGFWSQVTGYADDPDDPNSPEDSTVRIVGPDGAPGLLFIRVPEGKTVKNRIHFDLAPVDRTRDEEAARLLGIGATLVADHRHSDGTGWVVLNDPEGNEFCVERSAAERASIV